MKEVASSALRVPSTFTGNSQLATGNFLRRYSRHILLKEVGEEGQARLAEARVLVVGAGGLGAAALSYLGAAGIGALGIMDHDAVELSNLSRQIIHETGDIGRRKVESAADRLSELNPDVKVETFPHRFSEETSLASCDLVLDCSDNFPTRFSLNTACHRQSKTLVSAAVRGWQAQLTTFKSHRGTPHPCYRCFVPETPQCRNDCAENGVIGPLVGVLGSMQALEAIKELLGLGDSLSGRLLRYDALSARWRESRLVRDPECPVCSGLKSHHPA